MTLYRWALLIVLICLRLLAETTHADQIDKMLLERTERIQGPARRRPDGPKPRATPYENGAVAGRGWIDLRVVNDSGNEPVTIRMLFYRGEGWNEVVLFEKAGFYAADRWGDGGHVPQLTLRPGEIVGWERRGANPFSVGVFDQAGKNVSERYRFVVDDEKRTVTIRKK